MSNKICFLCKKNVDNEIELGEWKTKSGINVHYYCLLLTSNLIQKGRSDTEGILGFLIKDIRSEVNRIKPQKCYYCQEGFAGIGCCAKKCKKTFHLSCGIENKCRNYFTGTYQSFCDKHHMINHKKKHEHETDCGICYERMGNYHPLNSIQSACCKTGWFHKICLQKFAKSAGYFFKCPLCNNTDDFRNDVMTHGVFVPDKDAEWEMEPNAFAELLERANTCEAAVCMCPKSREFCDEKDWNQTRCLTCGNSVHMKCISNATEHYICDICCKGKIDKETIAALKALSDSESDDENSSVDTSGMAGSFQSVSGSRRRTIVDYFSPPEKKTAKTKPCKVLLERLDINKLVTPADDTNRSEADDDTELVPKLSKKWIELLQATYDSDSDIEYKTKRRTSKRLSSASSYMTTTSVGPVNSVNSESDIGEITRQRATKRLLSDSSIATTSSICEIKKRRLNSVDSDSDIEKLPKRASKRLLSESSLTTSPSPVKQRQKLNIIPEMSKSQVTAPICSRRRSVRLMSIESSTKSYYSSRSSTGHNNVQNTILENRRHSVSSSNSQSSALPKIENNNNMELMKKSQQTDFLIDYHELNRIRQEMQAMDVVARNLQLSSGSIYSAKDHLSKFMGKIADKQESYLSSTESESDLGIKDIEIEQTVTESDLTITNGDKEVVSDKYYFKMKTKDVSKKVDMRKSTGFARKSLNKKIEKSPLKEKENKMKKSPSLQTKPKFNLKSLQGQKKIDNYFTVYTGSKN